MAELMLVGNPRRKRRVHHRRRKAAANPVRRRRRTHRRRRTALLAAPRTHRRRARVHHRRRATRRRSYARNPRRSMGKLNIRNFLNDTLLPAGVGAIGALGADLVIGYAGSYLPASLQSGVGATVAKLGGAIAVGYVAGMTMGRKFGEQAMTGAVVVTMYDLFKSYATAAMPTLPLAGMGWVSPAVAVPGRSNMGLYVGQDNSYGGGMAGMGMYVGETEASYYGH